MRYLEYVDKVMEELKSVLSDVKEEEIENFIGEILKAKKIQVFGMGRVGFSMRAFAMRLMHLGFSTTFVYETTTPNIGEGDLLIEGCACTAICREVITLAKKAKAKVAVITAHPESDIAKMADLTIRLRGQVLEGGEDEIPSIQPMATLFEQSLFIFLDLVVLLLMEKTGQNSSDMAKRHTNLDGYMG